MWTLLFLACSGARDARPPPEPTMDRTEAPPPIGPQLIPWLDENAGSRRVQLPIRVTLGVMGIEDARLVGTEQKIRLDSTGMSRTLPMALGLKPDDPPTAFWLEGTWGPIMPEPGDTEPTLAVRDVGERVEGNPDAIRLVGAER